MAIEHVLAVVPVTDIERARDWYERLLGRAPDNRPMETLVEWQVTGGGWVQVWNDEERAGRGLLNLAVDDLASCIKDLAAKGISAGEVQDASKGVQISTVTDPDGNQIALIGNFRVNY